MKLGTIPLLVLLLPIAIHGQESPELLIEDSRFIVCSEEIAFTLGSDIDGIVESLGAAREIIRDDARSNDIYRWDGLELWTWQGLDEISWITVTSGKFGMRSGVGIGQTEEEVRERNGDPYEAGPGQWYYEVPISGSYLSYLAELLFSDGHLTQINICRAR